MPITCILSTKPPIALDRQRGERPKSQIPNRLTCQLNPMKATILLLSILFSTISIPTIAKSSSSIPLKHPAPALDCNDRGTTKFQRGDNQGAILEFDRAIKIDPKYAEAYVNRGVAKLGLGDKQGAIADYSRAIAIHPQDALIYYNRGVAKFELGDNPGAIADFDRAIAINPQDAETYSNRGAVKLAAGDKQGAIADLKKGAELFRQQGQIADYEKTIDLVRQAN
jgi:tetratricopeptide (TPR) repeat protein